MDAMFDLAGGVPGMAAAVAGALLFAAVLARGGAGARGKVVDTGGDVPEERIAKQGFSAKAVPADLDVIVIGSGMGGLVTAGILAKEGKRVLVLEQHDQAGGNTHTFEEHGFEFDTGLHYVGGRIGDKKQPLRKLIDYVTDDGVEWAPMDDEYDVAVVRKGDTADTFAMHSDIRRQIAQLIERFPAEEGAIRKYFELTRRGESGVFLLFACKFLPGPIGRALAWLFSGRLGFFTARTTQEVLDGLTDNTDLKGILSYQWGDYGELPRDSAFGIHSLLVQHYSGGAFYPVGGPVEIPRRVIRVVEKAGGKVLVRAAVEKVLVDDSGTAFGVQVKGKQVLAKAVVSSVGAPISFSRLVPSEHSHRVERQIKAVAASKVASKVSLMSLFVGLEGTVEELGLPKNNRWVFPSWDHHANMDAYKADPLGSDLPAVFMSFSSAKDPTYAARRPNKQVALVIGPCFYDSVAKFKDGRIKHRGAEYEALKESLIKQLKEAFLREYPHLESRIRYTDLGTAVTNDFYLGTHRGAVYGLAHTPERFQTSMDLLRPETPIRNLYLTGQDVLTCGIAGAAMAAQLTCMQMSRSFLLGNARKLA